MLSLIIGIIVFALGLVGVIYWWSYFIAFVLGMLPIAMVCAGIVAVIAGITSISENMASNKDEKKLNDEK